MVSLRDDFSSGVEGRVIVLFDSNMLLMAVQKPFNLFDEVYRVLNRAYRPVVLSAVKSELDYLANFGSPKERRESRLALELVKRCEVVDFSFSDDADNAIIEFTRKHGRVVVATNDIELRRKLRKLGVPVIFMRGFDHLDLEGDIY
ncbi:MAG: hypothetical protein NDF54_01330 [archaeon GB-1867-035]|nr:hypothetical protein [Candidatus Culexmicrobium profundum]